jgi:lysine 2,3-aminomutase
MPNYLISASDDCVILRNFEGMLVRYQAEDKPATIRPTANRGVSQLIQGTTTVLMPENSERMARRREYLQNEAEPETCCDAHEANGHAPHGRELLASLPVVAER